MKPVAKRLCRKKLHLFPISERTCRECARPREIASHWAKVIAENRCQRCKTRPAIKDRSRCEVCRDKVSLAKKAARARR